MEENKTKVAINGFGRIGRLFYRSALEHSAPFEVVAVNNPGWDEKTYEHLFKYDTAYGIFNQKPTAKLLGEREPEKLPWREMKIDIVVECTGIFVDKKSASKHLKAGAKKVIISAPSEDADAVIILGVNENDYKPARHKVISMASCTTNCLAPVVKVLQEKFGIEKGFMTTIHSYTADQNLQDGSHKDLRRARAAAENIVPTKTGAAKAIFQVIKGLENKMDGLAMRVPNKTGSLIDLVCLVKRKTSVQEVNKAFEEYAEKMSAKGGSAFGGKGILAVTDEPIVSSDIVKNENSSIVDLSLTRVFGGNLVKVISWYDNEWAYATRLVELVNYISNKGR